MAQGYLVVASIVERSHKLLHADQRGAVAVQPTGKPNAIRPGELRRADGPDSRRRRNSLERCRENVRTGHRAGLRERNEPAR